MRTIASILTLAALVGCTETPAETDTGTTTDIGGGTDTGEGTDTGGEPMDVSSIPAECATYCDGARHCAIPDTCSWIQDETSFASDCRADCEAGAATMTMTQVNEAIACLHCLDEEVDMTACAGTNTMLSAAVTGSCSALCGTPGVMMINGYMSMNFIMPDAGMFMCTM
jgi:hypothetical protein